MMFYQPYLTDTQPRRGVVLLVVIVMLALFAAVGITFVFYAEASSAAATSYRQSFVEQSPDLDAEMAMSMFLEQLLFGVPDDERGVYSALRGHDLLRGMWGMNYEFANGVNGAMTLGNNTAAFNGAGRLHYDAQVGVDAQGNPVFLDKTDKDNYKLINYTYFPPYYATDTFNFIRDPGRFGSRYFDPKKKIDPRNQTRGAYVEEFNPPYTYPDLNSLFLAAVNKNGQVLMPSYYRPWLFDPNGLGFNNPNNPNWKNDIGRYLTLRPRPWDQRLTSDPNGLAIRFPYPEDRFGDVRNLPGAGPNDSHWINIGAPVLRLPDGRKYTMLVAPLIFDLDGKVNLNVHGNIKGPGNTHASNLGIYAWEVAINQILNKDATPTTPATEWQNIFLGRPGPTPGTFQVVGRYGPKGVPTNNAANTEGAGRDDHYYAKTDVDAATLANDKFFQRILLPGMTDPNWPPGPPPLTPASLFPYFNPNRYQDGSNAERLNHPAVYNALAPIVPDATGNLHKGYNRNFRVSNLELLYRYGDTGTEAMTSELLRLCPTNMSDPSVRRLVTLLSANLHRAGAMPVNYPNNLLPYGPPPGPNGASFFPQGPQLAFPNPATLASPVATKTAGSEFGTDWRSNIAALTKIDLRRTLRQYPLYNGNVQDKNLYNRRFDVSGSAQFTAFLNAQADRQKLADDLYRRLLIVCGVPPVADQVKFIPNVTELSTRRWLAQLAVNIVDYSDEDDISTPFNFYTTADGLPAANLADPADQSVGGHQAEVPKYWVFGTEMPRLLITEVLAEHQSVINPIPNRSSYTNTVYVELFNPLGVPGNTLPLQQQDGLNVQLFVNQSLGAGQKWLGQAQYNNGYAPYKIVVATGLWPTTNNDNVTGKPDYNPTSAAKWFAETSDAVNPPLNLPDFSTAALLISGKPQPRSVPSLPTPYVLPNNPTTGDGYFLVGGVLARGLPAVGPDLNNSITVKSGVPANTPYFGTKSLQYTTNYIPGPFGPQPNTNDTVVTVFLRRLANPHLPPDIRPALQDPATGQWSPNPLYNPYVTIDYMENVPNNDRRVKPQGYASRGKRQPFAGRTVAPNGILNPTDSQVLDTVPIAGQRTAHTFGRPNTQPTRSGHFHWLTHLDRGPLSPIELLHVSKYQPHQLTQNFIIGDDTLIANRNAHTAMNEWLNPVNRIYRLFEYLECKPPTGWAPAASNGGRMVGQININTIWDLETFLALCDPTPAATGNVNPLTPANPTYFTTNDIATFNNNGVLNGGIYQQFIKRRTPGLLNAANLAVGSVGITGATDHPLWSLAAGPLVSGSPIPAPAQGLQPYPNPFPNGLGINDTLFLRANLANPNTTTGPLMFDVATNTATVKAIDQHPYLQKQLLAKIFNNVTTRSNTFAVFLTVGFFEVVDDSTMPVKLGAELGKDQNRQIRHRMFAVIDRTQLQTIFPSSTANPVVSKSAVGPGQAIIVSPVTQQPAGSGNFVPAITGTTGQGHQWQILPGMVLQVTSTKTANKVTTTFREDVIVQSVDTQKNTFTANFTINHTVDTLPAGPSYIRFVALGHPGPRTTPFNPHNSGLIAHMSIID